MKAIIALLLVATSCVESDAVSCADGRVCPSGTTCAGEVCATAAQLSSCGGLGELAACAIDGAAGLCRGGACIALGCGDGIVTGDEDCDGADLGGAVDCRSVGYHDPGVLRCTPLCAYDVTDCTRRCGDGVLDPEEDCDATPGAGVGQCTDFGFYEPSTVTCSSACVLDFTDCGRRCGDGVLDPEEICDGTPPDGSCIDYGYDVGPLTCSPFCGLGFTACKRIGWYRAIPAGNTSFASGVWSPRVDDVWVAHGFEVTRLVDGQLVKEAHSLVSTAGIWGTPGGEVFVSGRFDGGIMRRDTGGAWTAVWPQVDGIDMGAIHGTGPDDIWAVGTNTLLHYESGTWTPTPNISANLSGVWAHAPDHALAVGDAGGNGRVLRYDGQQWTSDTSATLPGLNAVWGSAPDDVWAAGNSGTIVRRDATGWSTVGSVGVSAFDGVWGRARDDVYMVGYELILRFDGQQWWSLDTGITSSQSFRGVGGNTAQTFVVAQEDIVLRNDGASWSYDTGLYDQVGVGTDGALIAARAGTVVRRAIVPWNTLAAPPGSRRLWVGSANLIVAGNPSGGVHVYNGSMWTTLAGGPPVTAVWATSASDVWTVNGANIAHWTAAWSTTTVAGATFHSISGTPGGDVFAIGTSIHRRVGTAWQDSPRPGTATLRDVWAAANDDVWAVGDGGVILHFDGAVWSPAVSGTSVNLTAVHGSGANDVWAVGAGGIILRYDGAQWSRVRAPDDGRYLDVAVRDDLVLIVEDTLGSPSARGLVALVRRRDW